MLIKRRSLSQIIFFSEKSRLSTSQIYSFLSRGTYDWIYVLSSDFKLEAKISFEDLINGRKSSPILSDAVLMDEKYTKSMLEELFIKTGVRHLPIVDVFGNLIGEYINYSKELESFEYTRNQYALSLMMSFQEDFNQYIASRIGNKVALVLDETSKYILPGTKPFLFETYTPDKIDLIPQDFAIIDSVFSEKFHNQIFPGRFVISMNNIAERILLSIVLEYAKQKSIRLVFVQGPEKRNRTNEIGKVLCLEDCILNKKLVNQFAGEDDAYAEMIQSGKGVLSDRDSLTNGFYMISSDTRINGLTISNGDRVVRTKFNSNKSEGNIHCFGSCLCFGLCCRDGKTIPDAIQQVANSRGVQFSVFNHGLRNGKYEINDFMRFLDLTYGENDVCIFINRYPEDELSLLRENNIEIIELEPLASSFKEEWFLDNSFHINEKTAYLFGILIGEKVFNNSHYPFTNSKSYKDFHLRQKIVTNFPPLVNAYSFSSYLSMLVNKRQSLSYAADDRIGSIIMTANPFTDGHESLIRYALSLCKHVFVFVVEEDKFWLSYDLRYKIVTRNLRDYKNITVLGTGEDLTSYISFPEYFSGKKEEYISNEKIDIDPINNIVFGKYICPILGITDRFLGEETDTVTKEYNEYVKVGLKQYGITVTICPREKGLNSQPISASLIRKEIKKGNISSCFGLSGITKQILKEEFLNDD